MVNGSTDPDLESMTHRPLLMWPVIGLFVITIFSVLGLLLWRPLFLAGPPIFLYIAWMYVVCRVWLGDTHYILEGRSRGYGRDIWVLLMFSCAVAWVFLGFGAGLFWVFLMFIFSTLALIKLPTAVFALFKDERKFGLLIIALISFIAVMVVPVLGFDLSGPALLCYVLGVLLTSGSTFASLWAGRLISSKYITNKRVHNERLFMVVVVISIFGHLAGPVAMYWAVLLL